MSISAQLATEITHLYGTYRHTLAELAAHYKIPHEELIHVVRCFAGIDYAFTHDIWPARTCEKYDDYIRSHR